MEGEPQPPPPHHASVLRIVGIVSLLFGLTLGALWLFTPIEVGLKHLLGFSRGPDVERLESFDRTSEAVHSYWIGDYVALEGQVKAALEGAKPDDQYYFQNKILEVSLAYVGADTPEERLAAMRKNLALYHEIPASQPLLKAGVLNGIISSIVADNDHEVYNAVFTDPEFQQFRVEGSANKSLTNLAEYSLSIRPTWQATLVSSRLTHGKWILDYLSKKKGEVGVAELNARIKSIADDLAKAAALYTEAEPYNSYSVNGVVLPAQYAFQRALLLGIAARADFAKISDAKAEFEKIFDYYDKTRAPDGSRYAILEGSVVAADRAYADFLADTGAKPAEIKPLLDQISEIVRGNPEGNAATVFDIKQLWQRHDTDPNSVAASYAQALAAAKISPAFKELLVSYGWEL